MANQEEGHLDLLKNIKSDKGREKCKQISILRKCCQKSKQKIGHGFFKDKKPRQNQSSQFTENSPTNEQITKIGN